MNIQTDWTYRLTGHTDWLDIQTDWTYRLTGHTDWTYRLTGHTDWLDIQTDWTYRPQPITIPHTTCSGELKTLVILWFYETSSRSQIFWNWDSTSCYKTDSFIGQLILNWELKALPEQQLVLGVLWDVGKVTKISFRFESHGERFFLRHNQACRGTISLKKGMVS